MLNLWNSASIIQDSWIWRHIQDKDSRVWRVVGLGPVRTSISGRAQYTTSNSHSNSMRHGVKYGVFFYQKSMGNICPSWMPYSKWADFQVTV